MQNEVAVADAEVERAVVAHRDGDMGTAVAGYRAALALDPKHFAANANLALILHQQGDHAGAERHLHAALASTPDHAGVWINLGAVHLAQQRLADAEASFRKALSIQPQNADALGNLGETLVRQGRREQGIACFRQALDIAPDHANALAALGQALWAKGDCDAAYRTIARAGSLAPFHAPLDTLLQNMQTAGTRAIGWHFPMLNDPRRNAAYREAIERHVKPGMLVLEIGCGAGLLAMLAARAGARVVTFEVMPDLAGIAREIVAANGLAERIAVVEKFSFLGQVGVDLPERADLLVTEIFDAGLLGEEVLRSVAHAREHLLKPDARAIPGGARLYGQLVESDRLAERMRVDTVEGFDMTAFNRFAPRRLSVEDMRLVPHTPLSDPIELFRFDFNGQIALAGQRELAVQATADGEAAGFMLWFELEMDGLDSGGPTYGSASSDGSSHWSQRLQLLERPRPVAAGETLRIAAEYLRCAPFVDLL